MSVCQHVANIFIFLSIFLGLQENTSNPRFVVWLAIALFIVGYAAWEFLLHKQSMPLSRESRRYLSFLQFAQVSFTLGSRVIRSAVLVFLALLSLAPVLKTLTEATSSDSIWALAFFLFFLHTLLADYTAPRPHESRERCVNSS